MTQTTQPALVSQAEPLREPTITVKDMHIQPARIFSIQSTKGATDVMMAEIMYQLEQIPNVTYHTDDYGNLYATKGKLTKNETYPAFVCHIDTVHKIFKTKQVYKTTQGNYFAMCYDDGPEQIGIGGDDFCGIIINIELMHRLKKVKCAFFLDEENGCLGSKAGDLTFFDDCRYAVQVDRKGNTDIIVNGNGTQLCSEEFKTAMNSLGAVYGYSATNGKRSDVIALKERGLGISCINLSAGYYKEHTKQEYVNERDLLNVLEFCIAISKDKKVYPHVYEKPEYSKSVGYNHTSHRYTPPNTVANRDKRYCKECRSSLGDREGIVCISCLTSIFESYKLKINESTGAKSIVVETHESTETRDYACLDDKIEPKFTLGFSEICLLCERMTFSTHEQSRGYCEECAICKFGNCTTILIEGVNIKSGYCPEHLNEETKSGTTCAMLDCYEDLKTDQENLDQLCSACATKLKKYSN